MSQTNRRAVKRWINSSKSIILRLRKDHQSIDFRVYDISKDTVSIYVTAEDLDIFSNDSYLQECQFYKDSHALAEVNLCFISSASASVENELCKVILKTSDIPSSHRLWSLLFHLKSGTWEKSLPSTVQTDPIPERGIYSEQARLSRKSFISTITKKNYEHIDCNYIKPETLTSNIENLVGSVEIPVGLVGPMLIHSNSGSRVIYAPLATSEGALVASASRGSRLLTESGGVTVSIMNQRMMRVPLFVCKNSHDASFLTEWLSAHQQEIQLKVSEVSRHAILTSIDPILLGRTAHVSFEYETGDAAGQNMTTTTTWHVCQWVMNIMKDAFNIEFERFYIDANISGDKKVNYRSFLKGRGVRVLAEARIPDQIMKSVMKVDPDAFVHSYHSMITGGIQSGIVGFNINIANVIAAMFTATGQDIASVHESSIGHFVVSREEDAVYCNMLLPSLIVGTIGGGTSLPSQSNYLEMIGCKGSGNQAKLAETICSICLALDISTLSAIANGTFAIAHEKLGRNRPIEWLKLDELDDSFFQKIFTDYFEDTNIQVRSTCSVKTLSKGCSIITELTSRKSEKLLGHFPFQLEINKDDVLTTLDIVVKSKPLDSEVISMLHSVASLSGYYVANRFAKFKEDIGFTACHKKELQIYQIQDKRFTSFSPKVYSTIIDEKREIYLIIMEKFEDLVNFNVSGQDNAWTRDQKHLIATDLGKFHGIYYDQTDQINIDIPDAPNCTRMTTMTEFWSALADAAHDEFPTFFHQDILSVFRSIILNLQEIWTRLDQMPKTLVHNDFNPRNIALKKDAHGDLHLFAYDWELATVHLPQHDFVEFLAFTLSDTDQEEDILDYIESHRKAVVASSGINCDSDIWLEGFQLCLYDFCINRLAFYLMGHTSRNYAFMDQILTASLFMLQLKTFQKPIAGSHKKIEIPSSLSRSQKDNSSASGA